jgi:hypothetical protein
MECFETVRKVYPFAFIFYRHFCREYIREYWPQYPAIIDENGVLMSDCFKCLYLSTNRDSLYIDTDIRLFSPFVIDPSLPGIGWNGTLQLNCILYSGNGLKLFEKIFTRFREKPDYNYCETRYEFEQVPHQIFKDNYEHLYLGQQNGWKNE